MEEVGLGLDGRTHALVCIPDQPIDHTYTHTCSHPSTYPIDVHRRPWTRTGRG